MNFLFSLCILLIPMFGYSKTVHVKGYTRKDGTVVQPHIRSSPDSSKWNNYGSSGGDGYKSPSLRDADHDGIPNNQDHDDDNDGVSDDDE